MKGQQTEDWVTTVSDDGTRLFVEREGAPGQICITAADKGFAIEFWADDDNPYPTVVASTSVLYTALDLTEDAA